MKEVKNTYSWTMTWKTRTGIKNREHLSTLARMLEALTTVYDTCETVDDFSKVRCLLTAFRDIVMLWPLEDFALAYDELSEWQQAYMGVIDELWLN